MNKKHMLFVSRISIFISILVAVQQFTYKFRNFLLTGSLVNFILVMSFLTSGLLVAEIVGACSPFLAKIFGMGPNFIVLPFISLGNIIFIYLVNLSKKFNLSKKLIKIIFFCVLCSLAKAGFFYFFIIKAFVPLFVKVLPKESKMISSMFSFNQLITALIGSLLAFLVSERLKK
ncbi:MAG: hypothetical protein LBJ09_03280 [Clostridiales bacterium]|jgi:hypothetical protein|nr:hypothetical protein [Clostridiales bacterium]